MNSGSWASFRSAAPPELLGEPDDIEEFRTNRCRCGAFLPWRPSRTEYFEWHYGEIVEVVSWDCRRCGLGISEDFPTRRTVFGPLPPWSDPHLVWNAEREVWEHYMAQEQREWDEPANRVATFRYMEGDPVTDRDAIDDLPF